ncbi:MAG: hypothetical protein PHS59_04450 [Paludibacter sp.]|nr:hypothetical protein [Paludibacter sp.]
MITIRKFWFVLVLPLLILSSCDLLESLSQDITFDAPDQIFTVTSPSAIAGLHKVGSDTTVEIFNKEIDLNVTEVVKDSTGFNLNIIKKLKLKTATIRTNNNFDVSELANLKMYVGETALDKNLVGEASSVADIASGGKEVAFLITNSEIYDNLSPSESVKIILVNDKVLTLTTVDLVLKTSYVVTIGF